MAGVAAKPAHGNHSAGMVNRRTEDRLANSVPESKQERRPRRRAASLAVVADSYSNSALTAPQVAVSTGVGSIGTMVTRPQGGNSQVSVP